MACKVIYEKVSKGSEEYFFKTTFRRFYSGEIEPYTKKIEKATFDKNYKIKRKNTDFRFHDYESANPFIKRLVDKGEN